MAKLAPSSIQTNSRAVKGKINSCVSRDRWAPFRFLCPQPWQRGSTCSPRTTRVPMACACMIKANRLRSLCPLPHTRQEAIGHRTKGSPTPASPPGCPISPCDDPMTNAQRIKASYRGLRGQGAHGGKSPWMPPYTKCPPRTGFPQGEQHTP